MADEITAAPVDRGGPDGAVPSPLPFPVAGIGAFHPGAEAYFELFRSLPPDIGMAFVVVSPLWPSQKGRLSERLPTYTSMPVVEIEPHTPVEPNHIYVLPPDRFVCISRGILYLEPRPDSQFQMPIDHFFRSLAADQKSHAVGVVLSGIDSDGALGLRTIKGEGGIAIVQDPEPARFAGMPKGGIRIDNVDFILTPARIAAELVRLGRQFAGPGFLRLEEGDPQAAEERILGQIFALLQKASGLNFAEYKSGTILRRIARRMILKKVDSLAEYLPFLQQPEEVRALEEDLLINVTRFFRDPELFGKVMQQVVEKLKESRVPNRPFRIWVAGCSSGEEVYSIAISLLEHFDKFPEESSFMHVFGTDASEASIEKARSGAYSESLLSDISPERLRNFFVKAENGWEVSKRVRNLCTFARHDLCSDPPYSRLDFVSCRNVLIYLEQRRQEQILRTFHYALRPTGVLFLGKVETINGQTELFTALDAENRLFGRMPGLARPGFDLPGKILLPESITPAPRERQPGSWTELEFQRAVDRIILARTNHPGIVVDEHLNVVFTRGRTESVLQFAAGVPSLHLMRILRQDLAGPVKLAIERAIQEDIPVQAFTTIGLDGDGVAEVVVDVLPVKTSAGGPRYFLVLFGPATARQNNEHTGSPPPPSRENGSELHRLKSDLLFTKRYLQSLIEDRDAKNRELISASEEAQAQNEELQSTNEELETTKEEIQSANEELQTINDELQGRNQTLSQVGNDLTNLLSSVNLPIVMLDHELRIRQFTPAAERMMNVRPADIGRPLREIRVQLSIDNLEPVVQEVMETLAAKAIEVQDLEKRWHLLRIRPYRTNDNKIEGAVLLLIDTDESRRAQRDLQEARDFSRAIIEGVPVPLVVLNLDLRIRTVNNAFRILAKPVGDIEGRSFPDLVTAQWNMREIVPWLEKLRRGDPDSSFYIEHGEGEAEHKSFAVRGIALQTYGERVILVTMEDITFRKRDEEALKGERNALWGKLQSGERHLERTQDELRRLAGKLFTSQEEERRRVARELHDDITQKLALLNMSLEQFALDVPGDEVRHRVAAVREQSASLTEDVRSISHRLHPAILDDLGLTIALKALTEEFGEREEMPADFSQRSLGEDIPREIAASLYRIAQEALRNVAKHAGKTHVKVSLEASADKICMKIVDFGQGFDPDDVQAGLGLVSMIERARLVAGVVSVDSAPGKGTAIKVEVPLARDGTRVPSDRPESFRR